MREPDPNLPPDPSEQLSGFIEAMQQTLDQIEKALDEGDLAVVELLTERLRSHAREKDKPAVVEAIDLFRKNNRLHRDVGKMKPQFARLIEELKRR